jgi:hypothetical protein
MWTRYGTKYASVSFANDLGIWETGRVILIVRATLAIGPTLTNRQIRHFVQVGYVIDSHLFRIDNAAQGSDPGENGRGMGIGDLIRSSSVEEMTSND